MITKAKFIFGISSRTRWRKSNFHAFFFQIKYQERRMYHISSSFVFLFQAVKIMKFITLINFPKPLTPPGRLFSGLTDRHVWERKRKFFHVHQQFSLTHLHKWSEIKPLSNAQGGTWGQRHVSDLTGAHVVLETGSTKRIAYGHYHVRKAAVRCPIWSYIYLHLRTPKFEILFFTLERKHVQDLFHFPTNFFFMIFSN